MSGVALRSGSGELWMACASFDAEEENRLTALSGSPLLTQGCLSGFETTNLEHTVKTSLSQCLFAAVLSGALCLNISLLAKTVPSPLGLSELEKYVNYSFLLGKPRYSCGRVCSRHSS